MMIFLAVLVGANTVICRFLNTENAKYNGLNMSTVCNYVTGLATSLVALLVLAEPLLLAPQSLGWLREGMMWLGGAFGVVAVQLTIYLSPRLPAFQGTLLLFIGQLAAGLALDLLAYGTLSTGKLMGGALVLAGLWHYQWVNKKAASSAASERV